MRLRCDECKKPITKWQRRRGRFSSCGPLDHTAWTADWVIHTACLDKAAKDDAADDHIAQLLGITSG